MRPQESFVGQPVRSLKTMLRVIAARHTDLPSVIPDGIYGTATRSAVLSAQRWLGIPETGIVDDLTWDRIYDQFSGIETETLRSPTNFPNTTAAAQTVSKGRYVQAAAINPNSPPTVNASQASDRTRYNQTTTLTQFPGRDLQLGNQDPVRQEVVR